MKVINKKKEDRQADCECGALLEFTPEDIFSSGAGLMHIECPECGRKIYLVESIDDKLITLKNIHFPSDFHRYGGVCIKDNELNDWVHRILKEINDIDGGEFSYICSGDSAVIALKHEDEYVVFVANNYWEACIPR